MTNDVTAKPDDFSAQLEQQRNDIVSSLPRPEDEARFISTLHMAVASRPELLQADRLSFWRAVRQAATDGLKPDGKEGVINTYWTKVKHQNANGVWVEASIQMCVWIPMILGIRKRAIELAQIYIDAEVVHANDVFKVVRGDEPRIIHEDPPLNKDRGEVAGAYAIFRKLMPSGALVIVHREIMNIAQISIVRQSSKAQNGDLWNKYFGEACRKTVARRGVKSVPAVTDSLAAIFQRDDALFDFNNSTKPVAGIVAGETLMPPALSANANAPALQQANASTPAAGSPMMPPPINSAPAQVATPPPSTAPQQQKPAEGEPLPDPETRYLSKLKDALSKARSAAQVQGVYDRQRDTIENSLSKENKQRAFDMVDEYIARFDAPTNEAAE